MKPDVWRVVQLHLPGSNRLKAFSMVVLFIMELSHFYFFFLMLKKFIYIFCLIGKIFTQGWWSNTGTGCPEQLWSVSPRRCCALGWTSPWPSLACPFWERILTRWSPGVFSNLNYSVILHKQWNLIYTFPPTFVALRCCTYMLLNWVEKAKGNQRLQEEDIHRNDITLISLWS